MADQEIPEWIAKGMRRKSREDKKIEQQSAQGESRETRSRKSESGKVRYEREKRLGPGKAANLQCEGSSCKNKESEATHVLSVISKNDTGDSRIDQAVLCPNCAVKSQKRIEKNFGGATVQPLNDVLRQGYHDYLAEKPFEENSELRQAPAEEFKPFNESQESRDARLKAADYLTKKKAIDKSDIEVQIPQPSFDETAFAKVAITREGKASGYSTFDPPSGNRNTEYKVTETGLKPWNLSKEPYDNPGPFYTSMRNGVLHYHLAREGKPDLLFADLGHALDNKPGVAAALMARHKQTFLEERSHPLHTNAVLARAFASMKEVPQEVWGTDDEPAGLKGRIVATPMPARKPRYLPGSTPLNSDVIDEYDSDNAPKKGTPKKPKWNWPNGTKGIPCQSCDSTSAPVLHSVKDHMGRELSRSEQLDASERSTALSYWKDEDLSSEEFAEKQNYKNYRVNSKCPECDAPRSAEMDNAYSRADPTQRGTITRVLTDASKLTSGQFKTILQAHKEEAQKDAQYGDIDETNFGIVRPDPGTFGGPSMLPVPELKPEEQAARNELLDVRQRSKTPPMDADDPRRIMQEAHKHMFCEDCERFVSHENLDRHIKMHDDMDNALNVAEETNRNRAKPISIEDVSLGSGNSTPPPGGNPLFKNRSVEQMDWLKKPENG